MIDFDKIWCRADILKYFRISNSTWNKWKRKFKIKGVRKGSTNIYEADKIKELINLFPEK